MEPKEEVTLIKVTKKTRQRLHELKGAAQSYDTLINRMIEVWVREQ